MTLISLDGAVKAAGDRLLLDRVSLGVAAGERIGVVGRNGAGKSTLLAVLAGRTGLDAGRAIRSARARIGFLPQECQLSGPVRQLVFGALPEHQWAAGARGRELLAALLTGIDLAADARLLSGGERRRVALAAVLREDHDVVLLDEPTNHLDIDAIGWLAGYLSGLAAALVMVTHDRWFLDEVTQRTWELADGQVHGYDGGYAAYVLARAERLRLAATADQRRRNLLRKELAWLRRGPPARTSKPRFRLEAAAELIADEPPARDTVALSRQAAARLGKTVLELEQVTVTAGSRSLLDDVTWRLGPGERVGVLGVNGSGKTTLLRLQAGLLPGGEPAATGRQPAAPGERVGTGLPAVPGERAGTDGPRAAGEGLAVSGTIRRGSTVRLGYLTQEPPPADPSQRVIEAAEQVSTIVRVGRRELTAGQLLDRLGLRGDRQRVPVADLSGGERRRLQLQLILMAEPNVLLLDEPTNDLDIDTLTELEDLLDGFAGSVVVVSHDRYFVERVTDHVLSLIGGRLSFLPGGVDEYLARARHTPGETAGARPRPAAAVPQADSARRRQVRKEIAKLDRQLERMAGQEAALGEAVTAAASDYQKLIDLGGRLDQLRVAKAGLEARWLELASELPD